MVYIPLELHLKWKLKCIYNTYSLPGEHPQYLNQGYNEGPVRGWLGGVLVPDHGMGSKPKLTVELTTFLYYDCGRVQLQTRSIQLYIVPIKPLKVCSFWMSHYCIVPSIAHHRCYRHRYWMTFLPVFYRQPMRVWIMLWHVWPWR